jgi:hypothetical protein
VKETFTDDGQLNERSRVRLANLQSILVDLLEFLERELVKKQTPWYRVRKRQELADFSLFVSNGSRRRNRASRLVANDSKGAVEPRRTGQDKAEATQ